jgi:predicted Rossmann-fold nucleotide-binding protein
VEEVLETVTWAQLGIHDRGVCLLNVNGFFDGILDFVCRANSEGFIHGSNTRILCSVSTAEAGVEALLSYKVPDSVLRIE